MDVRLTVGAPTPGDPTPDWLLPGGGTAAPVVWAPRAADGGDGRPRVAAPTAAQVQARGGWPAPAASWSPPRAPASLPAVGAGRRHGDLLPLPPVRLPASTGLRALTAAAVALVVAGGAGISHVAEGGGTARPALTAAASADADDRDRLPRRAAQTTTTAGAPALEVAAPPVTAPPATAAPAPAAPAVAAPAPVGAVRSLAGAGAPAGRVLSGPHGTDISYPQCDATVLPSVKNFAVIGITGGRPRTQNPCLAQQWQWAMRHGAAAGYVNVAYRPGCDGPCAYAHGRETVDLALGYAQSQDVDTPMVWLDVETLNTWSGDTALNAEVIRGAIDRVREHGRNVGVYSTNYQWGLIAGGFRPGVPVWYATGANDGSRAPERCDAARWGFTGGPVWLVQYVWRGFDRNVTCAPIVPESSRAFRMP